MSKMYKIHYIRKFHNIFNLQKFKKENKLLTENYLQHILNHGTDGNSMDYIGDRIALVLHESSQDES